MFLYAFYFEFISEHILLYCGVISVKHCNYIYSSANAIFLLTLHKIDNISSTYLIQR